MTDSEIDQGLLAAETSRQLRGAVRKRYRPIDAKDDVVELSGDAYDALLAMTLGVIRKTLGERPR